jgi:membrane glycosyltransferase
LYLIDKEEAAACRRQPLKLPASDLPREAHLDMPLQDFAQRPSHGHDAPLDYLGPLFQRRMFLIIGSFLLGLLAVNEMFAPLQADGIDMIDSAFCILFFGLFAWIAFGFLNAVAGLFALLASGPARVQPAGAVPMPLARTAVLMPIHNEEVGAVFRRLGAMAASIEAAGGAGHFDIFVLSDSNERCFAIEYAAFRKLREQSGVRIYYRRRERNIARKPGNIADWVRRFGGAYAYMIVLDADSLMSGSAMMRLATAMDARPRIGLLQTVPVLLNGQTMFARWHQFAAALYGPVASAGLRWWSGTEATFWGHNAILRVDAFAASCGLPELESGQLLGGHIMSHDMVEAALLRRRGWAVHMVTLPDGSYEEFPPTIVDHAVRDRRWCQGNLQHLRLLHGAGFHWVSRLQLVMGASAYITSPLWLLLLGAGIFEQLRGEFEGYLLVSSGWLLGLTIMLLLGPKIVALLTLTFDRVRLAAMGGWRCVLGGTILEIVVAMVAAPVTMLTQTMAIIDILRGRETGWMPQRRDVDGLDLKEVGLHYRWHVGLGLILLGGIAVGMAGMIWTLPVAIGLVLAPVTVWVTSRSDVGGWLARQGLFLSPADRERFDAGKVVETTGPAVLDLVAIPQN